jgi:hypothetical protein
VQFINKHIRTFITQRKFNCNHQHLKIMFYQVIAITTSVVWYWTWDKTITNCCKFLQMVSIYSQNQGLRTGMLVRCVSHTLDLHVTWQCHIKQGYIHNYAVMHHHYWCPVWLVSKKKKTR